MRPSASSRRSSPPYESVNPSRKPADHPSADAAQYRTVRPDFAKQHVKTMSTPKRKQVCGASTTDLDHVLFSTNLDKSDVRAGRRVSDGESNSVKSIGIHLPLNAR